ncbi:unnamed protein product [Cercospora beticola]|nr:unnamed protein product [Cercospora beticola]
MLGSRHGAIRPAKTNAYVCWSCRAQAQQLQRQPRRGKHTAATAEKPDEELHDGRQSQDKSQEREDKRPKDQIRARQRASESVDERLTLSQQRYDTLKAQFERLQERKRHKALAQQSKPVARARQQASKSVDKWLTLSQRRNEVSKAQLERLQERKRDGALAQQSGSVFRAPNNADRSHPALRAIDVDKLFRADPSDDGGGKGEQENLSSVSWRKKYSSAEGRASKPTLSYRPLHITGSSSSELDFLSAVSQQRARHAASRPTQPVSYESTFNHLLQSRPFPAKSAFASPPPGTQTQGMRTFHSLRRINQHAVAHEQHDDMGTDLAQEGATEKAGGIRAQLRQWQELHGHEEDIMPELPQEDLPYDEESPYNSLTRLPSERSMNQQAQRAEEEQGRAAFMEQLGKEGFEGTSKEQSRFMQPGDLVELTFSMSERESTMAIYIQRVAQGLGQYLTLNGRWTHVHDAAVPYSVSGWIDPKELEPLMKHLPKPETALDLEQLRVQAYTEDLDVPREITGPLIARLQVFSDEVREIYRRNASALDDAHNVLAHETDLRYGSLVSAATALLKTPADKLPLPALFTVRKALANGGFAFNIDRRSHRLTGYMQIRSKQQVRMVEKVRDWIREWQDDLALRASMDENRRGRHKPLKGAQILYGFIDKSRTIVAKQRQNREPVPEAGNVGPSKTRLPITSTSESFKVETEQLFTEHEAEIVKFIEGWCCSQLYAGLPRLLSLPPLILNALDLYSGLELGQHIGFLFLQELGAIMPHENRVRFDQHLLLPSSQHSKPLQNLMSTLLTMRSNHNLRDSLSDLRHDWKALPVYCIDDASAQEIDDGISIEDAGVDSQGRQQQWLHVHIANPTAFFSRDHPLAKMARHMGETIYMPERAYMMLPRWATKSHFSLAPDRPCLTFSAKLNSDGETLDHKVTAGIIRNVLRVTYDELESQVFGKDPEAEERLILTVGGMPPPDRNPPSNASSLTEQNRNDLQRIMDLAQARSAIRKRAGGIFFELAQPEMAVWQSTRGTGLAWDHPYRSGSRTVYGDPVIQLQTQRMKNWFTASRSQAQVLVSESMLLCSEIAAIYCAQRQIPAIYRGTTSISANAEHPKKERWEELLAQGKQLPMHLGIPYLQSMGYTVLRTRPLKHDYLGMDHYAKVTSPLRRYGDMILHWQIEAAIRWEATTGQSLIVPPDDKTQHDRRFLPFSNQILETIMLGLQPRENMITRAKRYSNSHWASMLLFRMHHFKEGGSGPLPDRSSPETFPGSLPPGQGGLPFKTLNCFVQSRPELDGYHRVHATSMELNLSVEMSRPTDVDTGLPEVMQGDIWEAEIEWVDIYYRRIMVKPLRLVAREGL